MAIYSSSSDSNEHSHGAPSRLFGRQRHLHDVLGGGSVANVLLWRDKRVSAAILAGVTVIWLLFEVVEYHFLTLMCHIAMTAMFVAFIWSNLAALFERDPPNIPEMILSEHAFQDFAYVFHKKLSRFLDGLYDIARGKDLKLFLVAIASLWIISVIGSCCNTGNLLYFGFLCMCTLPALYELYEDEVDHTVMRGTRDIRKLYRKFDRKVLNKIPRGPVKEKKFK